MILFINGLFGVGKTSAARVLVEKVPNATLYDPEVIGSVLWRIPGFAEKATDCQDYALWRRLVIAVALVLKRASTRTLVIPIAVGRCDSFDPIVAGLHRVDPDLRYFRLAASEDELQRRISSDSEDKGTYEWRVSHGEVCLSAYGDLAFGRKVPTDGLTSVEVADRILNYKSTPTG